MEKSVKLLLSLMLTLLYISPVPSLRCEMSVETDDLCKTPITATALPDMMCFVATFHHGQTGDSGGQIEPTMVVKGVAGGPVCRNTAPQEVYTNGDRLYTSSMVAVHIHCCETDDCNEDASNMGPPGSVVSCEPPNICPAELIKQLQLLVSGSAYIPPAFCNSDLP